MTFREPKFQAAMIPFKHRLSSPVAVFSGDFPAKSGHLSDKRRHSFRDVFRF